ncbi:MAG: hypothetical protein H7Z41_17500 [Cytophagales bacterium]|nr:hypothetical protein [Armatimonadota bacterium]
MRRVMGMPRAPAEEQEYAARLADLRASLPPNAFSDAWRAGEQLSWEAAAAEALSRLA